MERLEIEGGYPLQGEVPISGAKNAVLKLMAASLLAENVCIIRNVPLIKDVLTMIEVLRSLGAEVSWADHAVLRIVPKKDLGYSAPDELVREM